MMHQEQGKRVTSSVLTLGRLADIITKQLSIQAFKDSLRALRACDEFQATLRLKKIGKQGEVNLDEQMMTADSFQEYDAAQRQGDAKHSQHDAASASWVQAVRDFSSLYDARLLSTFTTVNESVDANLLKLLTSQPAPVPQLPQQQQPRPAVMHQHQHQQPVPSSSSSFSSPSFVTHSLSPSPPAASQHGFSVPVQQSQQHHAHAQTQDRPHITAFDSNSSRSNQLLPASTMGVTASRSPVYPHDSSMLGGNVSGATLSVLDQVRAQNNSSSVVVSSSSFDFSSSSLPTTNGYPATSSTHSSSSPSAHTADPAVVVDLRREVESLRAQLQQQATTANQAHDRQLMQAQSMVAQLNAELSAKHAMDATHQSLHEQLALAEKTKERMTRIIEAKDRTIERLQSNIRRLEKQRADAAASGEPSIVNGIAQPSYDQLMRMYQDLQAQQEDLLCLLAQDETERDIKSMIASPIAQPLPVSVRAKEEKRLVQGMPIGIELGSPSQPNGSGGIEHMHNSFSELP
jgi:hypothetical protein